MARDTFKQWWTKLVPVPLERSVFVIATSLVLGLFSATVTGYILFGIHLDERGLLRNLGADYARYRELTPMLIRRSLDDDPERPAILR